MPPKKAGLKDAVKPTKVTKEIAPTRASRLRIVKSESPQAQPASPAKPRSPAKSASPLKRSAEKEPKKTTTSKNTAKTIAKAKPTRESSQPMPLTESANVKEVNHANSSAHFSEEDNFSNKIRQPTKTCCKCPPCQDCN
jgi:hypothetical protein